MPVMIDLARGAPRLSVPQSTELGLSMAAPVSSSFVCDASMGETSVENHLLCGCAALSAVKSKKKADDGGWLGCESLRGW